MLAALAMGVRKQAMVREQGRSKTTNLSRVQFQGMHLTLKAARPSRFIAPEPVDSLGSAVKRPGRYNRGRRIANGRSVSTLLISWPSQ